MLWSDFTRFDGQDEINMNAWLNNWLQIAEMKSIFYLLRWGGGLVSLAILTTPVT